MRRERCNGDGRRKVSVIVCGSFIIQLRSLARDYVNNLIYLISIVIVFYEKLTNLYKGVGQFRSEVTSVVEFDHCVLFNTAT